MGCTLSSDRKPNGQAEAKEQGSLSRPGDEPVCS